MPGLRGPVVVSEPGGSGIDYIQDADPGPVGAGKTWLNTTDPANGIPSTSRPLLVRDGTNSAWDEVVQIHRDATGQVRGFLTFSDGGAVSSTLTAVGALLNEIIMFSNGNGAYWEWHAHVTGGIQKIKGGQSLFGVGGLGITGVSGNETWGVTPEGAEAFAVIATPADPATNIRVHWYDSTTGKPVLRFKQTDAIGTVSAGVALGCSGEQTTVGAAGPASNVPASPNKYLRVRDTNGDLWVVPAFAAS